MSKDFNFYLKDVFDKTKSDVEKINTQLMQVSKDIQKSLTIDPTVMKSFQISMEMCQKTYEDFKNKIYLSSMNLRNIIADTINPSIAMLNKTVLDIDWSQIREGLKQRLKDDERIMEEYDKRLWAFDPDLFDALIELNESDVSDEEIQEFIEQNLDAYMDYFKNDEIYSEYALILEQSYLAYKSQQYALSAFPLFAVIEGLIATAFKEYEIDATLKAKLKLGKKKKQKKKYNSLYDKLTDFVESNEDELAIHLLFFRRVFNVYKIIFEPSWQNHPQHINRNWMMHGTYDYETVTKRDVLKLFQLIKAAEIIKEITFEKEEKAS